MASCRSSRDTCSRERNKRAKPRTKDMAGLTVCPAMSFVLGFARLLRSLEQVSRLERQLAIDLEYVHAAGDRVDVHESDSAGNRLHRLQQLFLRIHDDDVRTMGGDQAL